MRDSCSVCGAVRIDAQIGLEPTPAEYVERLVAVFREVRRVLRDDGTLWLNLGDSYSGYHGNSRVPDDEAPSNKPGYVENMRHSTVGNGLKPKDLLGIPWSVAFALRADGWHLRSDIIWHKPNPMPESIKDRPTKAHEYLFLLSKSPRYFYDSAAAAEPAKTALDSPRSRWDLDREAPPGQKPQKRPGRSGNKARKPATGCGCPQDGVSGNVPWEGLTRNRRSVWTIPTSRFPGAHFATFPARLVEPCVLAGSRPGDVVLDPFCGSGTTVAVAIEHGRIGWGIDISADYLNLTMERVAKVSPRLLPGT